MDEAVVWLTIFILSVFVGIEVISKVSSTLHTPLMSGANAIHGVILLGAIIVTGSTDNDSRWRSGSSRSCWPRSTWSAASSSPTGCCRCSCARSLPQAAGRGGRHVTIPVWAQLVYLAAAVCFILALKGLSGPKTARNGNLIGAVAAVVACALPFFYARPRPRAADPRGRRGRHGRGRVRRPHRADDPDAADGGAVQRRRWRGGGARRDHRAARDRREPASRPATTSAGSPCWRRRSRSWSARCRSPAPWSRSRSSRS